MEQEVKTPAESREVAVSVDSHLRLAAELLKSGFLPTAIRTPQQALAIILSGKELGIGPMESLRQINIIQGKPTMSAQLMLALGYRRVKGFSCNVTTSTDKECVAEFRREGNVVYTSRFSTEDAKAMQLIGKDNWNKQPATMLRWRCISAGLRVVCPDAIAGLYTPEELNPDIKVDFETGEVVQGQPPARELMEATVVAAQVLKPVKVEYIDQAGAITEITQEVKKEVAAKAKPSRGPSKKPSLRVSREQIDVLDSYTVKEQLKPLGFQWNAEIGAWSAPFSEALLDSVCAVIGANASDYMTF